MNRLGKFLALPAGERHLLVTSAMCVATMRVALWVLPLRSVVRLLAHAVSARRRARAVRSGSRTRIAWAVQVAGRYVPGGGNCLVQALAAHRLLTQRGYLALVCIGVAPDGTAGFCSHAWVEYQGQIVIGGRVAAFTPLAYLTGDGWRSRRDGTAAHHTTIAGRDLPWRKPVRTL